MQQEILEQNPDAELRVYAIWIDRMFLDTRERWDGAGLIDPRVTHLWDGPGVSGGWFVGNLPAYDGGSDWDFYLLFGPEAEWTETPAPLLSSGVTVIGESERLRRDIAPLLSG